MVEGEKREENSKVERGRDVGEEGFLLYAIPEEVECARRSIHIHLQHHLISHCVF
jgi:hypothetical protein